MYRSSIFKNYLLHNLLLQLYEDIAEDIAIGMYTRENEQNTSLLEELQMTSSHPPTAPRLSFGSPAALLNTVPHEIPSPALMQCSRAPSYSGALMRCSHAVGVIITVAPALASPSIRLVV